MLKLVLRVLALAIVVSWFFLLRPAFLDGPASYVIVSGISMEPTMYTGDLALALKQGSYTVGDVVAFRVEEGETRGYRVPEGGGIVIHRIIGGDAQSGYLMQGDNNSWVDPWQPAQDKVVGRAVFFIPRLGAVFSYLQDPLRLSLAVGGLSIYISLAIRPVGPSISDRYRLALTRAIAPSHLSCLGCLIRTRVRDILAGHLIAHRAEHLWRAAQGVRVLHLVRH